MTVQVGTVTLHDSLWWENEYATPSVALSARRTIGGKLVVQTGNTSGGREITLSTVGPHGANVAYFTRAQIEGLRDIESAGTSVSLTYNSTSTTVYIKPGGIQVEPLGAKKTYVAADYYVGKLELLET